jgi:hypothetical protein
MQYETVDRGPGWLVYRTTTLWKADGRWVPGPAYFVKWTDGVGPDGPHRTLEKAREVAVK